MAYGYQARRSRDVGAKRSSQRAINKYTRQMSHKDREARKKAKSIQEEAQSKTGLLSSLMSYGLPLLAMSGVGLPALMLTGLGGGIGSSLISNYYKKQAGELDTSIMDGLNISKLKELGGKVSGGSIDQINQLLSGVQGKRDITQSNMLDYQDAADSWWDMGDWMQSAGKSTIMAMLASSEGKELIGNLFGKNPAPAVIE